MPTYRCTTPKGLLSRAAKHAVAERITAAHHAATGAPAGFAQVIFEEVAVEDHFLGGALPESAPLFVHGHIRAGRTIDQLNRLLAGLVAGVATAAGVPPATVWVYLSEIPASHMAEYGRVLPEPGQEAQWIARLPAEVRGRLERDQG
jgi:phenylpyruvate tautomerase PptA (4-oxalocrotonate tautomerase family)